MPKLCLLLVLGMGLACGSGGSSAGDSTPAPTATPAPTPTPQAAPLALYVYADVVRDGAAQQAFLAFAKARNITACYLDTQNFLTQAPEALAAFVAACQTQGVSVTLLSGKASWALATGHAEAMVWVNQVVAFTDALKAKGAPTPAQLQLDVEPYLLPAWDSDLQGTANDFLDLLDLVSSQTRNHLAFTLAMSFWFDGRTVSRGGLSRPLSEWVIDATDATVMMDYRDQTPEILTQASSELTYAATRGKKMTLAVSVKDETPQPTYITFFEEGDAFMASELSQVRTALASQAAFGGLAIFHYDAWKTLRP